MAKLTQVRVKQFLETWRSEGLTSVLRKVVFFNKEVIPAVKDLSVLPEMKVPAKIADVTFIEISEDPGEDGPWRFPSKSRYLRVPKNLKKGYRGFAVARGRDILGDIWYCPGDASSSGFKHPDLEWFAWFGVRLGDKDVYMFEMYVKPQERGGGLVNFLHWSALKAIRAKGFDRVYGYCTVDNIPALWVHRTLGYKELGRLRLHRFFSFTRRSLKGNGRKVLYRFFDLS
jgi:RimJ/RimL family protein N-acetyltransferase